MIEYINWIGLDIHESEPNMTFLHIIVGITVGFGLVSLMMDLMFTYFDCLPKPLIHDGWKHFKQISWTSAKENTIKTFSKRQKIQTSSRNKRKEFYAAGRNNS